MLRESSLQELAWAWESISAEGKKAALLEQRALLEELSPGLWQQLKAQQKEAEAATRAAKKAAVKAAQVERRCEKSKPIRISTIQKSLRKLMQRDEKVQMRLEETREQLMDQIIKQIRTES